MVRIGIGWSIGAWPAFPSPCQELERKPGRRCSLRQSRFLELLLRRGRRVRRANCDLLWTDGIGLWVADCSLPGRLVAFAGRTDGRGTSAVLNRGLEGGEA